MYVMSVSNFEPDPPQPSPSSNNHSSGGHMTNLEKHKMKRLRAVSRLQISHPTDHIWQTRNSQPPEVTHSEQRLKFALRSDESTTQCEQLKTINMTTLTTYQWLSKLFCLYQPVKAKVQISNLRKRRILCFDKHEKKQLRCAWSKSSAVHEIVLSSSLNWMRLFYFITTITCLDLTLKALLRQGWSRNRGCRSRWSKVEN